MKRGGHCISNDFVLVSKLDNSDIQMSIYEFLYYEECHVKKLYEISFFL